MVTRDGQEIIRSLKLPYDSEALPTRDFKRTTSLMVVILIYKYNPPFWLFGFGLFFVLQATAGYCI